MTLEGKSYWKRQSPLDLLLFDTFCWVCQECKPLTTLLHGFTLSCFSCVQLFVTSRTIAYQAPWNFPSKNTEMLTCPPGELPNPGIVPEFPVSPGLQADILPQNHQGKLTIFYSTHYSGLHS